jgi:hypothetical protein
VIYQWVYFQLHDRPLGYPNGLGSVMVSAQLEMGSDHAGGWYAVDVPERKLRVTARTHMAAVLVWLVARLDADLKDFEPAAREGTIAEQRQASKDYDTWLAEGNAQKAWLAQREAEREVQP